MQVPFHTRTSRIQGPLAKPPLEQRHECRLQLNAKQRLQETGPRVGLTSPGTPGVKSKDLEKYGTNWN